ncbi:MAG TPA: DUF4328 domain-containing protein [Thermoanaerobaculia bacterium]|nr:DUF4328 domain-containing protein [Thermoanaerobaculia bacterium]
MALCGTFVAVQSMVSETEARFVDPVPAARAAMTVLAVGLVLDVHRLVYVITHQETPGAVASLPNVNLHLVVRAATLILFLVWLDRVWMNLAVLSGAPPPRRAATMLSLLVPPSCFVRPVRMINQAWSAQETGDRWFLRLTIFWWVAFLIPPALVLTAIGRRNPSPDEVWIRIAAGESMNVIAAMLAITIVHLISQRQRAMQVARKQQHARPPLMPAVSPGTIEGVVVAAETASRQPVTIAPALPPAPRARRRQPSLEVMIRAQAGRRASWRQAIGALRSLLSRASRR